MPLNLSTRDMFMLLGLPAITDLAGNVVASNAAGNAANAQIQSTQQAADLNRQTSREALDLQRQVYNDQVQRNEPYRQGGLSAFSRLLDASGLPAPAMSSAPSAGIPATSSTSGSMNWTPPQQNTQPKGSWIPGAINAGATLGSLALMGGHGAAGAAGAIGTLNPATGALVTGGSHALGTLGALATNPLTIGAAAVGLGVAGWLKSQAHWEANSIVKDFENPFLNEFLAPLNQAIGSGQIDPQEAVRLLDQNWQLYKDSTKSWAGTSSDKQKVQQQSIANPQLLETMDGIRQNAMQRAGTAATVPQAPGGAAAPPAANDVMASTRDRLLAAAEHYRAGRVS